MKSNFYDVADNTAVATENEHKRLCCALFYTVVVGFRNVCPKNNHLERIGLNSSRLKNIGVGKTCLTTFV